MQINFYTYPNRRRSSTKAGAILVSMMLLSGCSWFGSSTPQEEPVALAAPQSRGPGPASNLVLHRLGAKIPMISGGSRNRWIQVRKSKQSAFAKLEAAAALGDWEKTVIEARVYLRDNPKNKGALKLLATGLLMRRSFEMALYYAKVYDQFYPDDAEIYNIMGLCYLYLKTEQFHNYKNAVAWLSTSMEKSEDQIAAGLNLGYLYLETGNFYKAADVFSTTSQRCGGCPKAKLGYGMSLLRTNRYKEAKRVFREILARNPADGTALFKLALVEKNGFNNIAKAKAYLTTLISSPRIKNAALKRRANVLLRTLEGGV